MIQLNRIKPQVYLDTSMKKTPISLPESNHRGGSSEDFAINRFNDHKVIIFGRNSHSKEINVFELLLKNLKTTPENLVTKTLKEKILVGKGKEAEVFEIPIRGFENYLLRRNIWDKTRGNEDFTLILPVNPFCDKDNISTTIATIGPYQIINKIDGRGLDDPLNYIRNDAELKHRLCAAHDSFDDFYFNGYIIDLQNCKTLCPEKEKQLENYNLFKNSYINQLKELSKMPVSSYIKMFNDIKEIYNQGFEIDYSPGNLFYDKQKQQIGFIDLTKCRGNEQESEFDLFKLIESLLSTPFMMYIDYETQKEAKSHCNEIINKLFETAKNTDFFDQSAFNRITYNIGIKKI